MSYKNYLEAKHVEARWFANDDLALMLEQAMANGEKRACVRRAWLVERNAGAPRELFDALWPRRESTPSADTVAAWHRFIETHRASESVAPYLEQGGLTERRWRRAVEKVRRQVRARWYSPERGACHGR
jgi:hypothetical protein